MKNWQKELDAAREAARLAGDLALKIRGGGIAFDSKSDASPVTIADRECERLISATLRQYFPGDGQLGEEGAAANTSTGRRWIIDPIDGTRDFVRGIPTWSNLIALEADGEVVVGVCNLPALGEMFYASRGNGAWCNELPVHCSTTGDKSQAVVCLNTFNGVLAKQFGVHVLERLRGYWGVRSMGGCFDAMLIARGSADIWIEIEAKPWDLAAIQVICEEAGARFFNFDGGCSIEGGNCVICAPGMEAEALRLIS